MNRRIWAFIQGGMDAKEIKAYYEDMNPQDFNLTSRIAYRMIFLCPWLLKAAYPIYRVYKYKLQNLLRGAQKCNEA